MMATSLRMRNALTLFSSVDDVLCHRVRLFLAFFTFLAWLLKKEYWRDVH